MRNTITLLFFFSLSVFVDKITAQQNPQYTQYMYNLRSINAGYMINEPGIVEVGGIYRTQWSGITGAPKTGNLFASIPLRSKLELGVNFFTDKVGSNIQLVDNNFNIDVAYKVKLSRKMDISFGLKTGVNSIRLNPFNSNVANDPIFNGNSSATLFNLGAGIFVFNDNYYFGLSTPNFIQNSLTSKLNENIYTNSVHFYAIGGYIFEISEDIKVKPSFVIKHTNGAPLSFDVSANVLLYNKFELGIANRNQDAFSALTSFYVTPNFRIGYAYDFNISNLKDFNSGSHELMLLYRFDILGLTKKYMSPRFY